MKKIENERVNVNLQKILILDEEKILKWIENQNRCIKRWLINA